MREGSLEAPTRHPFDWESAEFYDEAKLDDELRRVFDICHGCRRCFNLCDSFPRLFDLVDESKTGEMDGVDSMDFKKVADACTLCDMCFLTKCPYVPPHEFNLDFPHLMVRFRAVENKKKQVSFADKQLAKVDRNGKAARFVAPLANWASSTSNAVTRPVLSAVAGLDSRAALPPYCGPSLDVLARQDPPDLNRSAPAFGRKAVIFATCFGNYNDTGIGMAARQVLAVNGVETEVLHPRCCGMPLLEQGDLAGVADAAKTVSAALVPWIDKGYDVIALVPSCALMLKFEWPLVVPKSADVRKLSQATFDLSQYVVDIAKKEGLAPGMAPVDGGMSLHMSCHSRAQNMGQKAAEMLRLIPGADVQVVERCSGHGGAWGFKKRNFETAMKVGKPVARTVKDGGKAFVTSECPLAGVHIVQGIEALDPSAKKPEMVRHPIQLMARSYGF